jgi:hypothetical protein
VASANENLLIARNASRAKEILRLRARTDWHSRRAAAKAGQNFGTEKLRRIK